MCLLSLCPPICFGKDSAKNSYSCSGVLLICLLFPLLAQALSEPRCCHGLNLRRSMVTGPRAATGALLCPGVSAAFREWGNSPAAANPSEQHCHLLPLNEEECRKCPYPQHGLNCGLLCLTGTPRGVWTLLNSMPTLVGNAASGSLTTYVIATRDCRGLLRDCQPSAIVSYCAIASYVNCPISFFKTG